MLAPTFHHLNETVRYLADLINLPAGYCVGLIGLLVMLGLALVIAFAHRRRTAWRRAAGDRLTRRSADSLSFSDQLR